MDIFNKLHINIPFADALEQMPSYAKFLILFHKRKLEEWEIVLISEKCSAVIQQKLPKKPKDPGCSTISCVISNLNFDKALCDQGASVNLIPWSIFKKLDLGEVTPTTIIL